MRKCLLLKFPDNREFFTEEKNLERLSNFANALNIKILNVEAELPELLDLDAIAQAFCNQSQKSKPCKYQIVIKNNGPRRKILNQVNDIRSHIESELRNGQTIRIKELHQRFSKHNIAVSTLYRHLSHVKEKLEGEGCVIEKVMVGCYRLEKNVKATCGSREGC